MTRGANPFSGRHRGTGVRAVEPTVKGSPVVHLADLAAGARTSSTHRGLVVTALCGATAKAKLVEGDLRGMRVCSGCQAKADDAARDVARQTHLDAGQVDVNPSYL